MKIDDQYHVYCRRRLFLPFQHAMILVVNDVGDYFVLGIKLNIEKGASPQNNDSKSIFLLNFCTFAPVNQGFQS